jgi:hypothetical protein
MTATRPRCAWCGKLIRPATETVRAQTEEHSLIPIAGWRYTGNAQILARRYETVIVSPDGKARRWQAGEEDQTSWAWKPEEQRQGTRERRLESVTVWDGERYVYSHWPFCTARCAGEFAEDAYRAGYRRNQRAKG